MCGVDDDCDGLVDEQDPDLDPSSRAPSPRTPTTALEWVHVAVAFDGADVSTWRDGARVTTAPWTGPGPLAFTALRLGTDRAGTAFIAGEIDDVVVFGRALDDAEVQALHDGSAACLPL